MLTLWMSHVFILQMRMTLSVSTVVGLQVISVLYTGTRTFGNTQPLKRKGGGISLFLQHISSLNDRPIGADIMFNKC